MNLADILPEYISLYLSEYGDRVYFLKDTPGKGFKVSRGISKSTVRTQCRVKEEQRKAFMPFVGEKYEIQLDPYHDALFISLKEERE